MNPHRRSISTEFLLKSTVDTTSTVFSSRRIRIDRRYRTYSRDGCAMESFGKNEKGNGKEPDTGHSSGQKRRNPDGLCDDADEEPSTRPCLHLENGSEHGSSVPSGISTSATMSRALRRLPAGQIRETIIVRSEAHACTILNGLQQIYQDESLCDVTLRVDGEDFRAHRVVLAASSDFLRSVYAPVCTLHLLAQATCMADGHLRAQA